MYVEVILTSRLKTMRSITSGSVPYLVFDRDLFHAKISTSVFGPSSTTAKYFLRISQTQARVKCARKAFVDRKYKVSYSSRG